MVGVVAACKVVLRTMLPVVEGTCKGWEARLAFQSFWPNMIIKITEYHTTWYQVHKVLNRDILLYTYLYHHYVFLMHFSTCVEHLAWSSDQWWFEINVMSRFGKISTFSDQCNSCCIDEIAYILASVWWLLPLRICSLVISTVVAMILLLSCLHTCIYLRHTPPSQIVYRV